MSSFSGSKNELFVAHTCSDIVVCVASLANASQHTVNQLLSRVGERQEAVRKRKASVAPKQKGSVSS